MPKENTLISYEEALEIVLNHATDLDSGEVGLSESLDRILAEDLKADRDFPPFNRVTMDGIAINYQTFQDGQKEFQIEKTQAAGDPNYELKNKANCVEIMTGAMMPINTDTIIRYEDLEIKDGVATVKVDSISQRQNIHFKGLDHRKGDLLVAKNTQIGAAEISIAATIGKEKLRVLVPPKALVISTGNELVAVDTEPKPHQIRRSNPYTIQAILKENGWNSELMHLPDESEIMQTYLRKALAEFKLLIFSGGVSAGKYDHTPDVLKKLGIYQHFHKVKQRPGKPFWFGTSSQGHSVFAFPGNPVSMFMCCHAYLVPWMEISSNSNMNQKTATLATDFEFKKDLTLFKQVRTTVDSEGKIWAHPIESHGSGDFVNLVEGDGILILPAERNSFSKGESFPLIYYR